MNKGVCVFVSVRLGACVCILSILVLNYFNNGVWLRACVYMLS